MREIKTRITENQYAALSDMAAAGGYASIYDLLRDVVTCMILAREKHIPEELDEVFEEVIIPDQTMRIRNRKQ